MLTQCPKCGQKQETPGIYAGRQVKCTGCRAEYSAVEFREMEDKIKPPHIRHFEIAGRFFLTAIGQAIKALFMSVLCLSIIVVGLSIAGDGGTLGGIQYLLAVIAMCLLVLVHKK